MEVYVAESLTGNSEIAFNAGNHTELVKLSFDDYLRLVQPHVFKFSWKTVSMGRDPDERWADEY